MTDDPEVPHMMRVPCFNSLDGCKNSVLYMGVSVVHKICPSCMESGAPSERTICGTPGFNFETEARRLRHESSPRSKIPMDYFGGEAVYEITARPKTANGGRVAVRYHN